MAATARVEFRLDPEVRSRIEAAASLVSLPLSEFVRSAAEERADEVLASHRETRLPAALFDEFLDALDAPYVPNEPSIRAARRARELFTD